VIGLLTGWGLSAKAAKLVAYVALPLLLLVAFYLLLDAYGDARYDAGKSDENAAWVAAQDKLLADAAKSTETANKEDLTRQLEQAAKVQEEKEKIDAAIADGSSPFDVLFASE
jgi:hypothetical protein